MNLSRAHQTTEVTPRAAGLVRFLFAAILLLFVEAKGLHADVISGSTVSDGLVFSWQYDLAFGAGFVLIEDIDHEISGVEPDLGIIDLIPGNATNVLVGPGHEEFPCVSSGIVIQGLQPGHVPGNTAVITFNFPAADVVVTNNPILVYDYAPVASACICGLFDVLRLTSVDFVRVEAIVDVDSDSDGVPDIMDSCPATGIAGQVTSDGRPIGDVDGDCTVTVDDVAVLIDDLLDR